MRRTELAAIAIVLSALPAGARGEEPLTLERAVARALAQHTEVRHAEAEVRAAAARLEGASPLLPTNPEVAAAAGPRDGAGRRTVDYEVGLSQRIEIAGQRGARIDASRAALHAAEARLVARRAEVVAEVRDLFGRLAAATALAEIAEDALRIARQGAGAAEKRFEAGDAAQLEVNSARFDAGRAARAALDAAQRRSAIAAELEVALALDTGERADIAFDLAAHPDGPERPLDELLREGLSRRADIAAARLDVAAAEAGRALAARAAVPTPSLGVSFAREEDAHVVLGTLSVELPLFARNQAERGVASARLDQARAALAHAERRAVRDIRLAVERLRAAREAVQALESAAATASETLTLVTRAYQAGQIEFTRYVLLRREAIEVRRDHVDALEALNRAKAQLDRVLGAIPGPAGEPPSSPTSVGRDGDVPEGR